MPSGKLERSRSDRMIAGVCGGLAKWLGWDSTAVRALYIVATILPPFPGIIVYVILGIIVPLEDEAEE